MKKLRIGFRGQRQLPLILIWYEWWNDGEVVDARVVWDYYPTWLRRYDGLKA